MKEMTTEQLRQMEGQEGIASRTLRRNGMAEQAKEMQDRIMGGDCSSYEAALGIIGEYVNITGPDGPEQEYLSGMTMQ